MWAHNTNSPNLSLHDVNKMCFVLQGFDAGISNMFDCINCVCVVYVCCFIISVQ